MKKKLKISLVIPCLNEKETIASVIDDAIKNAKIFFKNSYEIIVSDNGSTDGSIEIIKRYSEVRLINVPVRGYGAALHWGIMNSKSEYIVFADADMSYPFFNLKQFSKKLSSACDLILGSRLKGEIQPGAMPLLNRYFGTPFLTWLIRLLYGIPTTDCNSGMRIVRKDFYNTLNMRNSGMEWASELLLKTALKKGKYAEVPIKFMKDGRSRKPHLSRWSDGWRHLKSIVLLKPVVLILIMGLFLFLSFATYPFGFGFTSLFILLFVVFFFSYLALMFLSYAIEKQHNYISIFLSSNFLVPGVMIFIFLTVLAIWLLPNLHLGTKMLLAAIDSIILMWTFLVETIKTHLVNRLPDLR